MPTMPHLPRVKAFPIASENSFLTKHGAALRIPASEKPRSRLIGKIAPDFELEDHLGRLCSLHATIALGRPIVLFFFPLAGSPHCTVESCSFRDAIGTSPVFQDTNAIVIGISQDPPARAKRFVDEHKLGYRILFDRDRSVMESYNVGRALLGLIDQRRTFVIDPSGFIRGVAEGVFDGVGHRKFAEKWLVRIEHEMSLRQRSALWVPIKDDDLAASVEAGSTMRVVYGAPRSAAVGGVGSQPRYGSVTNSAYPPSTSKTRRAFSRSNGGSSGRNTPIESSSNGSHTPEYADDAALSDTNSLRSRKPKWSTLVRSRSHEESSSSLDHLWKFRSRIKGGGGEPTGPGPEPPMPPAYHNLDDGGKQYYAQVHPQQVATSLVLSSLLPSSQRASPARRPIPLLLDPNADDRLLGAAVAQPHAHGGQGGGGMGDVRTPHSHSMSLDTASTWATNTSSRQSFRSTDTVATSDDAPVSAQAPAVPRKDRKDATSARWKGFQQSGSNGGSRRSSVVRPLVMEEDKVGGMGVNGLSAGGNGISSNGTSSSTSPHSPPYDEQDAVEDEEDDDDEEFVSLNARGEMEVLPRSRSRSSSAQGQGLGLGPQGHGPGQGLGLGLRATSISGLLGSSLSLDNGGEADASSGWQSREGTPGASPGMHSRLASNASVGDDEDAHEERLAEESSVGTTAAGGVAGDIQARKGSISTLPRALPRPLPPPVGVPPPAPRLSIATDLSSFDISEVLPVSTSAPATTAQQQQPHHHHSQANRFSSSYASSSSSHFDAPHGAHGAQHSGESYYSPTHRSDLDNDGDGDGDAVSSERRPSIASVGSVGTFGPVDEERERGNGALDAVEMALGGAIQEEDSYGQHERDMSTEAVLGIPEHNQERRPTFGHVAPLPVPSSSSNVNNNNVASTTVPPRPGGNAGLTAAAYATRPSRSSLTTIESMDDGGVPTPTRSPRNGVAEAGGGAPNGTRTSAGVGVGVGQGVGKPDTSQAQVDAPVTRVPLRASMQIDDELDEDQGEGEEKPPPLPPKPTRRHPAYGPAQAHGQMRDVGLL